MSGRQRQYVPPKRPYVSVIVHDVINPKTILRTKEQDLNHMGILDK